MVRENGAAAKLNQAFGNKTRYKVGMTLRLSYQPPLDFKTLLWIYRSHQVGNVEWFVDDHMFRVFEFEGQLGQIEIFDDQNKNCLIVKTDFSDRKMIAEVKAKVRAMFDLDSDPLLIAKVLAANPAMRKLVRKHPGVRLFSGWDPFEIAISTILGQLVSLARARTLIADFVELYGRETDRTQNDRRIKLFPTPETLAAADFTPLKTTRIRKKTLSEFARAVVEKRLSLANTQDPDQFVKDALALYGIGPWSAHYMALRMLRHSDAFPVTDLILARALSKHPEKVINRMRPWRGYVAALLWREYA